MILRILFVLLVAQTSFVLAQAPKAEMFQKKSSATRAIRRDVPMTRSIQKAFKAGTRNFSGRPGPNYWQLKTDFDIQASLNPDTQTITGKETIALHNTSPDDLKKIVLRLDHNLFRPKVPRGFSVPAETTDGMVVTRLVVNGVEVDLEAKKAKKGEKPRNYIFGLQKTIAHVFLVNPIKAGSVSKIGIEWHTKLPGGKGGQGHRMTQRWGKKLFQPTQWFPRLAKYDDLRGWETSLYLGPAEFYNNFGKFNVKIEMPAGWLVSGTGILQNPEQVLTPTARKRLKSVLKSDAETMIVKEDERGYGKSTSAGKTLVWHYAAENVNDFAWATSNEFVWRATRANIPQKGFVPIHMFYLPERADKFKNAGKKTRHAMEFYSKLLGPYPFPQLTLQDGPSAGMEYPMVINSNQGAADHETFHQWVPMMVGNNETRYAWMDEGFNNYSNILSNAAAKGEKFNLNRRGQQYGSLSGNEWEAPMMWEANYAGQGYGYQAYGKTTPMLSMLGGMYGDETVHKALRNFMQTWKFKHPSPWDFMFFMNNELDSDLGWFWYYWLFSTESVDGSVKSVSMRNGKTYVTIRQAGQMPSPIVLKIDLEKSGTKSKIPANAKMLDENTVLIKWSERVWFDGKRDFDAVLDFGARKIKKITLDPYGRFPDRNPKDNIWRPKKLVATAP